MKKRNFLVAALALFTMSLSAQTFKYEVIKSEGKFKGTFDDETTFIYNTIDLKVPASCSDATVNVQRLRTSIFNDLVGEDYSTTFSSAAEMQNVVKTRLTSYFSEDMKNYKIVNSIPEDEMFWSNSMECEPVGVYQGVYFLSFSCYTYSGGAHGNYANGGRGFDLKTGKAVNAGRFFNTQKQKAIVRMLCSTANVRKYHTDGRTMDSETCKELVQGLKESLSSDFSFPSFYIKDAKLHLFYQPYEIACYAVGISEFIIPLSVVNSLGQKAVSSKPKSTTKRR